MALEVTEGMPLGFFFPTPLLAIGPILFQANSTPFLL